MGGGVARRCTCAGWARGFKIDVSAIDKDLDKQVRTGLSIMNINRPGSSPCKQLAACCLSSSFRQRCRWQCWRAPVYWCRSCGQD